MRIRQQLYLFVLQNIFWSLIEYSRICGKPYFASPEAVEEGHMILSHVWDESKEPEMSFQDVQRIHEQCTTSGEDPHDLVNTKLRKCCELAENHGYKWAWIDTCCIDKTSSAELMEAINAMYQFYALSLVCYVYIPDFWYNMGPDAIRSRMRNSTEPEYQPLNVTLWQERGWTLQELIAPRVVHFLSGHWKLLGTKHDLADYLEVGLGIPASVLRHEQSPFEFSVSQRMSWAANRKTTRPEDEAYCLLGLFGINMPTLYGEGRKAFQRLQEEILKQTGDTTLFAWGESALLKSLRDYPGQAQTGLLASKPSDFKCSRNLQAKPPLGSNSAHHRRRIGFKTTSYGPILARMPILHLNGQAFADLSWYQNDARILLVLTKCTRPPHLPYPIYDIGVHDANVASETPPVRLVKVHNFQANVFATHTNHRIPLRTILLVRRRSWGEGSDEPIHLPLNHRFPPSIRFPEHLFRSLLNRPIVTEVSITNAQLPWSGDPPFITTFRVQTQEDVLYATLLFGLCTSHTTNGKETGSLWATFRGGLSTWECTEDYSHQCTADHVLNWPDLKRRFVVEFHTNDKVLRDHISKWILDMEFTLSIHTEALVLTHIDCHYRVLFSMFGYHDSIEEREEEERMKQTQAPVDIDRQGSPASTRGQEVSGSSTLTATLEEVPQSATEACGRRLCPRFLFHRLVCACFTGSFVNQVWSLPFLISVFIQSLHLDDPPKDYIALGLIDPATLHGNGPDYKDLSLLLL